jgi:ATP-binding cassette subfamily F protein uup
MAGPALVHVNGLRLSMGAVPLFDDVDFVLHKGERACLVGANGAGKTTLMRMLAGEIAPDSGVISFASGATLAWVSQEPDLAGFATLREFACSGLISQGGAEGETPIYEAEAALEAFGLDPDRATAGLSGGETRRAALARSFAADPDILLLDEPTNHLDILAIEQLEQLLAKFRGACLVISHDRRFLERVSTACLWLRQRKVMSHPRGFSGFDAWAEAVELEEARAFARLETHLRAEEHWLQRGVTARRSRNEGRRRKLMAMRAERRERTALSSSPKAQLSAEQGSAGAKLVIDVKGVSKAYGERTLIDNLSLRLVRGDRLGVVGPNGAGKTTLLDILLGKREADSGTVRLAENLRIAYVDQNRAILNPKDTIWEALAPLGGDQVMVRGKPRHVHAYAKDFLFEQNQLRQPISALSGGERNRLALAVALTQPADLLVLDEPTNDLDIETLDALEDMLASFEGTVILVSHDRAFLDGVATQTLGALGQGRWAESPGGWVDFEREYGGFAKPAARTAGRPKLAPITEAPRKQAKLSFKDEHRLREIDALAPKLETEIAKLEAVLAAPDTFARDPVAYEKAARRLAEARVEKDTAETEWLDIEARREALTREA